MESSAFFTTIVYVVYEFSNTIVYVLYEFSNTIVYVLYEMYVGMTKLWVLCKELSYLDLGNQKFGQCLGLEPIG